MTGGGQLRSQRDYLGAVAVVKGGEGGDLDLVHGSGGREECVDFCYI